MKMKQENIRQSKFMQHVFVAMKWLH